MKRGIFLLIFLILFSLDRGEAAPWTEPYIEQLVKQRRLKQFPRSKAITRADYAVLLENTFLIVAKNRHWTNFTDLSPSHWAHRSLRNAYEAGFLGGDGNKIFPEKPMTRLEVMVSLSNGFALPINPRLDRKAWLKNQFVDGEKVPTYAIDAVAALAERKIWLSTPQAPRSLGLNRPITSGELAVLFYEFLAFQQQVPPIGPVAIPLPEVTRLEVSLSQRRVTAYRGGTKFKSYPIAVGRSGWETPRGTFAVAQLIQRPAWKNPFTGDVIPSGDPDNPLGQYWIGFWTNGKDWSGFHGTPNRSSVGQAVSHGCLRMYNEDIKELFALISQQTVVKVNP